MSALEAVQVKLGLTTEKAILKQTRLNKMWRKDEAGEFLPIQFDSREFKFRPGKAVTVGKLVANGLIRSSAIIVGADQLTGPIEPYVVKIAEYQLGEEVDEREKSACVCPICKQDQQTPPRLTRHLMTAHKDDPRMEELDEKSEGEEEKSDRQDGDDTMEEE